jgi:hypothetical protein
MDMAYNSLAASAPVIAVVSESIKVRLVSAKNSFAVA